MHHRQNALHEWLIQLFAETIVPKPLAGDASFRRYFRLYHNDKSYVLMDAPPEKEPLNSFLSIHNTLNKAGIRVPQIHATEETLGFILLEDLGDQLLLNILTSENADLFYRAAMDVLRHIQLCPIASLPSFDERHMHQEMELFQSWFLEGYLKLTLNGQEKKLLHDAFSWLSTEINQQPRVFIHRDYHSRNLLVIPQASSPTSVEVGVLDFQDAMQGPFTYDLVSLLKDCYVKWPRSRTLQWVSFFYDAISDQSSWTLDEFVCGFDLCGVQRHLKVLGIFCRLHLRDNKSGYLNDLPLVMEHLIEGMKPFAELKAFQSFLSTKVNQRFMEMQTS